MSLLLSFAIAWPLATVPVADADTLLGPLHTSPAGTGPAIIFREERASSLVALRLSVRATAPPGLGGAATVLQELARVTFESRAARYGARAELRRTPTHLIYALTGPAADFAALVGILEQAIEEPRRSAAEANAIWANVVERGLEDVETPAGSIRLALQRRLFPDLPVPPTPTDDRPALTADALRAVRGATFQPDRMLLVIVGAVDKDEALSVFGEWKAPDRSRRAAGPEGQRAAATKPQVYFPWAGAGYPADDLDPAVLAVAAPLLERRLSVHGVSDARAELWWSSGGRALVVLGSARPGPGGPNGGGTAQRLRNTSAVHERIRRAVNEVATLTTEVELDAARGRLRRDLLRAARTPDGLAELLGEFHDRTGEPEAASRFLEALDGLRLAHLRRELRSLPDEPPVKVEVSR